MRIQFAVINNLRFTHKHVPKNFPISESESPTTTTQPLPHTHTHACRQIRLVHQLRPNPLLCVAGVDGLAACSRGHREREWRRRQRRPTESIPGNKFSRKNFKLLLSPILKQAFRISHCLMCAFFWCRRSDGTINKHTRSSPKSPDLAVVCARLIFGRVCAGQICTQLLYHFAITSGRGPRVLTLHIA